MRIMWYFKLVLCSVRKSNVLFAYTSAVRAVTFGLRLLAMQALFGFLTGQVRAAGVLKMDDMTDRFLRTLTELAVAHCLASAEAAAAAAAAGTGARYESAGSGPLSFIATDALVSLIAALVVQLNGGETFLSR